MTNNKDIAVILLAGGVGRRFGSDIPKQFLTLGCTPVVRYSFEILASMACVSEVVVVCAPEYQKIFAGTDTTFALPGERRQDSVYNGLQALTKNTRHICVHDAARPMITPGLVQRTFDAAREHGAAAVGMPVRFTVKEVNAAHFVTSTPNRDNIWEIQTPQVIRTDWLCEGFDYANDHALTVTDDVSLAELVGHPVKLIHGDAANVKITTPEDFALLEKLLERKTLPANHA